MRSILISFIMVLFAGFASAQNFNNMSDADTEAFGAAVRAYLLDNPEVIMEAVDILQKRQKQDAVTSDLDLVTQYSDQIFNDGFSHISGNPDGPIQIVEFSDYKCGYCKKAFPEILQLIDANPDIRFVLKEYPILGAESVLASRAAISVLINEGDETYERFHNALMRENGPLTDLSLPLIAEGLGIDSAKMIETMNTSLVTQIIQTNRSLGQQMQISGTPTFVVGTQMLRGYVPLASMQQIVDDVRKNLN